MTSDKTKIRSYGLLALLATAMAATRYHHFGDALHLPDASLAVFFIAGASITVAWAFPVLLLEAGAIDWLATSVGGVSDWCLSPAYWFLIPTYACLWFGGRWYAQRHEYAAHTLLPLAGSVFVAASLAFVISNGSFYALSGRFPDLSWADYAARVAQYYLPYVLTACAYVAAIAVAVVLWTSLSRLRARTPAA